MDFIEEKKHNFEKFLHEKLPVEFNEYIAKLEQASTQVFIFWIKMNLSSMKDKIDTYIDDTLKQHGYDRSQFPEEDMAKFKRYLGMFISLCQ